MDQMSRCRVKIWLVLCAFFVCWYFLIHNAKWYTLSSPTTTFHNQETPVEIIDFNTTHSTSDDENKNHGSLDGKIDWLHDVSQLRALEHELEPVLKKFKPKPMNESEERRVNETMIEKLRIRRSKSRFKTKRSCSGRYIYVHNLPSRFNDDILDDCEAFNKWHNMCPYIGNNGLGPNLGNPQKVFSRYGWYLTNQFMLEVIFRSRMTQYECITKNSSEASAIYVPYYAGLDVSRYIFDGTTTSRDALSLDLAQWLREQPEWNTTYEAFCVLAKLVQDGKAKRREISAFALAPKDRLSNLIRRVPNEAGIQDSGVGSVEGTGHEGKQNDDRINDNQCNVCGHQDGILVCCDSFHRSCVKKVKDLNINSSSLYFCGTKCREIHTKLNKSLPKKKSFGKKTQLQDGFSFSLLKSYDLRKRLNKIDPIKAECKAKLAQAFDILNQCFLPSVDAINNTNIIQHLVYNQGSHIRRLSYSGFFIAILEKDDEVISTATIRIHGNKLAEMPFVGTREKYWGKGMCRHLLDSIENVLGSFGVEELVLPSTSTEETLQIWTKLGFKPLKESTKQTMKYMSVAVFAGTTILQKRIPKNKNQKLRQISQVLGSFGVEELVLPSTSTEETLQIWTKLGFKPLKESTKQTMKYMSIAVFAGTTILQKRIPKNKNQKLRQISQHQYISNSDNWQMSDFNQLSTDLKGFVNAINGKFLLIHKTGAQVKFKNMKSLLFCWQVSCLGILVPFQLCGSFGKS
ncbi:exostosin-like protein [Artemisia annua]|uniref:Exostosin-like protein n=1 Tax=Artemisia annua TaxID=35608 RepID=A0A2U1MED2_ARTAN|nr:exostosin-like protein [Artemisia annua]